MGSGLFWGIALILEGPWEEEGLLIGEGRVAGNILMGPGLNGITVFGRNVQVVENHLLGFWLVGIEALATETLTIQGNTVAVAGVSEAREEAKKSWLKLDLGKGAGIFAFSGWGGVVRLEGNVVTGNAGFGILMGMTKGGKAHLSENAVIRSEIYSIALLQEPCVTEDDIKMERIPGGFSHIARRIREALTPPPDLPLNLRFEGELSGEGNTILGAGQDDLCPAAFPWPPGFKK